MKVAFYPLNFLAAVASLFVAYAIITGLAAQYVPFAGPDNEIGCFVIASTMGIISLFSSFGRIKQ